MSKFSEKDFEDVTNYLEMIDSSKVGIFKINVELAGWKDYEHVDINKGIIMEGPVK